MRYLSVCSGIEAASVAWAPLGWTPVAFSEIDPFACAVLAHRHPGVPNWGDMTRFEEWPDEPVDLLVGGTPCQDYSVAGARAGMAGSRGALTLTYVGIARRVRPRWVLWENVPGVFSSNAGRDFARFLGDLAGCTVEVPEGGWQNSGIVCGAPGAYGLAWVVRDAQFVRTLDHPRAVPQRRRRVFVVGHLGDWRPAAAVLLERESLRGDPPPRRAPGKGAAPTLAARTRGGCGLGTDFDVDGGLIPEVAQTLRGEGFDASEDGTGRGTPIIPEVCNALAARDHKQPRAEDGVAIIPVAPTLRAGSNDTGGHRPPGTDVDTVESLIPVAFDSKGSEVAAVSDGSTPTLRAMGHSGSHANAGGQLAVAFDAQAGGETGLAIGDVAGALHGGGKSGGRAAVAFAQNQRDEVRLMDVSGALGAEPGMKQQTYVAEGHNGGPPLWQVRRLTPRECERLQGFPDGYTLVPLPLKSSQSRVRWAADGPRYKALGNSMAVNVMAYLGARIALVEALMIEDAA